MAQTKQLIDLAGSNRVPVPDTINSVSPIHGAMDNFDHEESTSSGIGRSHDTILVLFQKAHGNDDPDEISHIPNDVDASRDQRSLSHTLECQKLIKL